MGDVGVWDGVSLVAEVMVRIRNLREMHMG